MVAYAPAIIKCAQESFTNDAARLWNQAPDDVKTAASLGIAKSHIKKLC